MSNEEPQTLCQKLTSEFETGDLFNWKNLDADIFIDACKELVSVLQGINSVVMKPVIADVRGNVEKMSRYMWEESEDIRKMSTVQHICENDSVSLLWFNRALEFMGELIHWLATTDKTMTEAIRASYSLTLKRHHNLIQSTAFYGAFSLASPDKSEFMKFICGTETGNSEDLLRLSKALKSAFASINSFCS